MITILVKVLFILRVILWGETLQHAEGENDTHCFVIEQLTRILFTSNKFS